MNDNIAVNSNIVEKLLLEEEFEIKSEIEINNVLVETYKVEDNWQIRLNIDITNETRVIQPLIIEAYIFEKKLDIKKQNKLDNYKLIDERTVLKETSGKTLNIVGNVGIKKEWNSEKINIYKLIVIVKNKVGIIESFSKKDIIFKEVKVKNNNLILNESNIKLFGINYSSISEDEQENFKELKFIKETNINTLNINISKTKINEKLLFEILKFCQELGIYVIISINLIKKVIAKQKAKDLEVEEIIAKELIKTIAILKEFQTILMWRIIDTEGNRYDIAKIVKYIKEYDNSRALDYVDNISETTKTVFYTDFVSKHKFKEIEEYKDIEELRKNSSIYDNKYKRYEFSYDVTKYNKIKVKNKFDFMDLSEFSWKFELLEDGGIIQEGYIENIKILPNKTKEFDINIKEFKRLEGVLYYINLYCIEKIDETEFVKDIIQLPIEILGKKQFLTKGERGLSYENRTLKVEVTGRNFRCTISKKTGNIINFREENEKIYPRPFELLCINNGKKLEYKCDDFNVDEKDGIVKVSFKRKLINFSGSIDTTYLINGDGDIIIENKMEAKKELDLMSVNLYLEKKYDKSTYFGYGTNDKYLGIFESELINEKSVNKTIWYQVEDTKGNGILIENANDTKLLVTNLNLKEELKLGISVIEKSKIDFSIKISKL